MQTRRKRAVAAVTATALAAGSAVVLSAVPATAQEATGGEGRFVQQIQWMDFGANGETVPADGFTKTERIDLGGQEVDLTCVIGPQRGGTLKAYRSGEWQGDALDDLYNVGGTGRSNTLVNALANEVDGSTVTFDFSCSATVNGEALPLGGLVIADAEQSRTGEYVAATAPSSATWRIIDRFRDAECDNSNIASVDATNRLKIESPYTASCSSGPSTVAFLDGATSASSVELKGGGLSAIALGVVMTTSRSDAPDSFGGALHLQQPRWSGGDALSAGGTAVSEDSFGLATLQPITPRFGEDASTDDGLTVPASITTWPGQRVRIPVQCSGTGAAVAAWADWDHDGKFSPDERVTGSCDAAASVEWTVPDDVASGDLHIRARTASSANQVASPDGLATSGETESYTTGLTRPAPVTTNDRSTTGQNTPIDVDVLANDHPSAVAGTTFETESLTVFDGSGKPVDVVEVDGGTVAVRDGELRFTPAAGFVGTIGPVRYGIQDSIKQTAQGTAEVVVTAVEPVAADDQVSTSQGRAVAADVLSNDAAGNPRTPLDPGSLRLQGASGLVEDLEVSGEGTYSIADGGIRFVPASSFSGTTSRVTYSIADVDGTRTTATLTVTVDPVTPVAAADTATVRQGGTVTTDVLANDVAGGEEVDLDRSTLSLNGAGEVEGVGTFEVVDGKIRFTGAKPFTGEASIDYTVRDTNGTPATATLTVTVDPVTPVAMPDAVATEQSDAVTVPVLDNDLAGDPDVSLDPATLALVEADQPVETLDQPDVGTWTIDGLGVHFAPVRTFTGTASATYRVADGNGTTTDSTVDVTVTAVVPVTEPDDATTDQGAPISMDVLGNDRAGRPATPIDAESLALVSSTADDETEQTAEGQGTWTVTDEHRIRFAPETGFVGTATATYAVEDANGTRVSAAVHVDVVEADLGLRDDSARGQQGHTLTVEPLANDEPVRGGALDPRTLRVLAPEGGDATAPKDGLSVTVPGEGRWAVSLDDAEVRFEPEADFSGTATPIRYSVANEHGVTATAEVTASLDATPEELAFTGAVLPISAVVFAGLAVLGGLLLRRRRA